MTSCDAQGNATLSLRNKFAVGEKVELVGPDTKPFSFAAGPMQTMEGAELQEARTPQMLLQMKLPRPVPAYSIIRHAVELSG